MDNIPIKFKRVAEAFDEAARWTRACGSSSSGSEYWPESGTDLSDLVNSFIEKGDHGLDLFRHNNFDIEINESDVYRDASDGNGDSNEEDNDAVRKDLLQNLLLECEISSSKTDGVKQKIFDEINVALTLSSACSNDVSRRSLKRNVVAHLRHKGFDAGLCKSRWEKTRRLPAGRYEYIDVNAGKTRYIVEICLAGELEIVRPRNHYSSLLQMIPSILIIENPQLLNQLMRLMTAAMRDSLKNANMHIPPWRRNGYMQAKYSSPYKRTINPESTAITKGEGLVKKKSTVGFETDDHIVTKVSYYCRDVGFGSKVNGVRVGLLGVVLQGN